MEQTEYKHIQRVLGILNILQEAYDSAYVEGFKSTADDIQHSISVAIQELSNTTGAVAQKNSENRYKVLLPDVVVYEAFWYARNLDTEVGI